MLKQVMPIIMILMIQILEYFAEENEAIARNGGILIPIFLIIFITELSLGDRFAKYVNSRFLSLTFSSCFSK